MPQYNETHHGLPHWRLTRMRTRVLRATGLLTLGSGISLEISFSVCACERLSKYLIPLSLEGSPVCATQMLLKSVLYQKACERLSLLESLLVEVASHLLRWETSQTRRWSRDVCAIRAISWHFILLGAFYFNCMLFSQFFRNIRFHFFPEGLLLSYLIFFLSLNTKVLRNSLASRAIH